MIKITDKKRLNWLERSRWGSRTVFGKRERTFNGSFYSSPGSTVRETIDASIRAKKTK